MHRQQAACGQAGRCHLLGHHGDAPAHDRGTGVGLGRRHVALHQAHALQAEGLADPGGGHVVLAVEHQPGQVGKVAAVQASWQGLRRERRAGDGDVAHAAQRGHPTAPQRLGHRADAAQHSAFAQTLMGEVLVVDDQLQAITVTQAGAHHRVERRQHPGGQAVGIDRDRQAFIMAAAGAQLAADVGAHRLHLAGVAQQHFAGLGQAQRARSHHQQPTQAGFQRP